MQSLTAVWISILYLRQKGAPTALQVSVIIRWHIISFWSEKKESFSVSVSALCSSTEFHESPPKQASEQSYDVWHEVNTKLRGFNINVPFCFLLYIFLFVWVIDCIFNCISSRHSKSINFAMLSRQRFHLKFGDNFMLTKVGEVDQEGKNDQ